MDPGDAVQGGDEVAQEAPTRTGGPPSGPVRDISPETAWMITS